MRTVRGPRSNPLVLGLRGASVAQGIEQDPSNVLAAGSNPAGGTTPQGAAVTLHPFLGFSHVISTTRHKNYAGAGVSSQPK
jgi:hypothetical protein